MAKKNHCCVSSGEVFNVGQFLQETSSYMWASMGIYLCIGFNVLGYTCPHHTCMFCAHWSMLGSGVHIPHICYTLFWGGWTMSLCNLLCEISVGITWLVVALADAVDPGLFMKVLLVEVFDSILGLFGCIGACS
ncbi:hypothetical protein EI94DRAFT_1773341 [Lactarius quietus]|nr:hypothetical protein EI94DRAFT_1773341 [Lactarius quietus]